MKSSSKIERIDKLKLCLGCGLCESLCGKENVEMKIGSDGFYHPKVKKIKRECDDIIGKICPGRNVVYNEKLKKKNKLWGKLENIYSSFSNDATIRKLSSSGGVITSLAIYLLEESIVDAVLHVKSDKTNYENNVLSISKSRNEVIEGASSKYAPAKIFNNILSTLDNTDDNYCFIGKPCDIVALKNLIEVYPKYKDRIKFTISLICAGMPSFKGTELLIEGFNAVRPINNLKYRGNGWPGCFSFHDANEDLYKMTYNDSWGKVLCKNLNFRCKICPDGIGLFADVAVGDAWETKDGYPDFTERDGQSLVLSRTEKAQAVIKGAIVKEYLIIEQMELEKLSAVQPHQYSKRGFVIARIMAFNIVKFEFLKFRRLALWRNLNIVSIKRFAKEFLGTFHRLIRSINVK